jgi:uncharacterized RDD family membrane protein YckC
MMGIERLARRPVEAAARSSRYVLAAELDRAIEHVLAGSLPEKVAQSVIDHRVVERIVTQSGVDEDAAGRVVERLLADERVTRIVSLTAERIVTSAEFEHALATVLQSPQIRRAVQVQAGGFKDDVGAALRRRCAHWDDVLEIRAAESSFAGVVSRGVALVVDAALALVAFVFLVGSFALVSSLVSWAPQPVAAAIGLGAVWTAVVVVYFAGFWSTAGQTPGMRLMRVRVVAGDGRPPSTSRSLLRVVWLMLSIALLFLGLATALVDRRRRALHDFVAGTVVVNDVSASP